MKRLFIISFLLFVGGYAFGQDNFNEIRQQVLEKESVGEMFVFGKWTYGGEGETHLKYLGKFSTKDGRQFKIITSSWYWGMSKRATSRVLVFNEQNQYVGNYYVDMVDDLPYKLEESELKFHREHCDKVRTFAANFKNGLSIRFFVGCAGEKTFTGTDGDFYWFDS